MAMSDLSIPVNSCPQIYLYWVTSYVTGLESWYLGFNTNKWEDKGKPSKRDMVNVPANQSYDTSQLLAKDSQQGKKPHIWATRDDEGTWSQRGQFQQQLPAAPPLRKILST